MRQVVLSQRRERDGLLEKAYLHRDYQTEAEKFMASPLIIYYATHSKRPECHREAVVNACGLRSISDFQLLTLERRKSVIQDVMRSLDVRPRQLSRVTGMNYETIRNIAKKLP